MSTLVIGLTEEQKERMHAYENECAQEEGRKDGRYDSVDKLVGKGVMSVAEACEVLEVDAAAYLEYKNSAAGGK